ncbi:hypothetical protein [Pedobacter gandavensis]|uniref:Uncharacterized protein n=1 Tax=Pedobacter gandavensis TaxID=2679963 RepID=A0ABR6ESN4_9SPHI|nr:hypothetical protein [Pedobacter gandavensis]MBB2148062.1 hypothetical protein [Pedobacter gandavensis]
MKIFFGIFVLVFVISNAIGFPKPFFKLTTTNADLGKAEIYSFVLESMLINLTFCLLLALVLTKLWLIRKKSLGIKN